MNPLISIIVPVYNVEKYLSKCVDSLLNQTYKNTEILLVDDSSTDNSGYLCDQYAITDKRITVIHKENGGLSDARNAGLDRFKGEYVTFVDSDDYLALDCVETLYQNLIEFRSDFSITNLIFHEETTGKKWRPYRFRHEKGVLDKESLLNTIFYFDQTNTSACGKLYRRGLFTDIRYPKGKNYEDLATIYHIVDICNRVSYINREMYYYTQTPNSIIRGRFNLKKLDLLEVLDEMIAFIKVNYPSCHQAALNRFISGSFHIYYQIPKDNPEYSVICEEIRKNIIKHRKSVLWDKKARKKVRVALLFSYLGFDFTEQIFGFFRKTKIHN